MANAQLFVERLTAALGVPRPSPAELFLGELAASANVRRAAEAAGFSAESAYRRRWKDPHFAHGWDMAIATGRARVEAMLVALAGRSFDPDAVPLGEEEARMSIEEALSLLRLGQRQAERVGQQRAAPRERVATQEEAIAALAKRLAVFGRRVMAERAEREGQGEQGPSWE